jgi:hypothetical protein
LGRGKVDSELRDKIHTLVNTGVELPIFFKIIGTEEEGAIFVGGKSDIFYTTY